MIGYPKITMIATSDRALTRSYPAVPGSAPAARRELGELAIAAGATPDKLDAVRLAVSEAVTNAVVHAYPDRPGAVHITAAVASNELWVLVADDGCGLEAGASRPGLGLGLALIAQASDDFTVVPRSSRGLELRMRFNLERSRHARWSARAATFPRSRRFSTMS